MFGSGLLARMFPRSSSAAVRHAGGAEIESLESRQLLTAALVDGQRLTADLTVSHQQVLLTKGFNLNGHTLTLDSALVAFIGGGPKSIKGPGTIVFGGQFPFNSRIEEDGDPVTAPLTLSAGITITGKAGQLSDGFGSNGIINHANIVVAGPDPNGRDFSLSGVINDATITVQSGKMDLAGNFINNGTIEISGGDVLATNTKSFTNNGTIDIGAGRTLQLVQTPTEETLTNTGRLTGNGTINANVLNSGTVSPGAALPANPLTPSTPGSAPGKLTIGGSFTQVVGGVLRADIGPASDLLQVTGQATLGGMLDVYTASAYHPKLGSAYTIMRGASVAGTFATLDGVQVGGGVALSAVAGASSFGLKGVAAPVDHVTPKIAGLTLSAPKLGDGNLIFRVTFSDNVAIDVSTLAGAKLTVTGPNGFVATATLMTVSKSNNGLSRTATFVLKSPGGKLAKTADGTYSVALAPNIIKDTAGNALAAGVIGKFTIAL